MEVSVKKPHGKDYPKEPKTIGEHIKKRRLDLRLLQKDVALTLKVTEDCITNWENNKATPMIRYIPRITEFLGYSLFKGETETLGGKIKYFRYMNGLSHKKLGKMLGVDASTVAVWEGNKSSPHGKMHSLLIEKIMLVQDVLHYNYT